MNALDYALSVLRFLTTLVTVGAEMEQQITAAIAKVQGYMENGNEPTPEDIAALNDLISSNSARLKKAAAKT